MVRLWSAIQKPGWYSNGLPNRMTRIILKPDNKVSEISNVHISGAKCTKFIAG
jgi:hypothetical protein